jgi:hypothetical protein
MEFNYGDFLVTGCASQYGFETSRLPNFPKKIGFHVTVNWSDLHAIRALFVSWKISGTRFCKVCKIT